MIFLPLFNGHCRCRYFHDFIHVRDGKEVALIRQFVEYGIGDSFGKMLAERIWN